MILLIFTVSAGDQLATPAALPRCPWEPVSPAAFTLTARLPNMQGEGQSILCCPYTHTAWEQGAWLRLHSLSCLLSNDKSYGGGVIYIPPPQGL